MHPVHVDAERSGFLAPAVDPVYEDVVAQRHADIGKSPDALDIGDGCSARSGCTAIDVLVEHGKSQDSIVFVEHRPEIFDDAEWESHE